MKSPTRPAFCCFRQGHVYDSSYAQRYKEPGGDLCPACLEAGDRVSLYRCLVDEPFLGTFQRFCENTGFEPPPRRRRRGWFVLVWLCSFFFALGFCVCLCFLPLLF